MSLIIFPIAIVVSTHSHPKVAALMPFFNTNKASVSTHSHPKVAAPVPLADVALRRRFNTQPPEGGCMAIFQVSARLLVSTHSHPKVAANAADKAVGLSLVSTHSHPKVAASKSISS